MTFCARLGLGVIAGWICSTLSLAAAEERRVVVISPHNESIRHEFGRAFSQWHQTKYGELATVEWRDLGGTSDALKFVISEFSRKPAGIGLDCFYGGGGEPFLVLADKHLVEAYQPPAEILDPIPQSFNGIEVYDAEHKWYGAVLSSFGILQNTRVQRLMGLPLVTNWVGLTEPRLYNWVGAGDPRNSGTMNVMFEAFLQAYGWEEGWQIITRLAGNVRKFDHFSTATAKDVTLGETAYALAIDFYGFTQVAVGGRTNLTFVLPQDFTAINPDGISILKGAPHPETARRFIDFVLSEAGQKLWFLPKGHPEGPQTYSIERMSIRPDFYKRFKNVSNIEFSPFDLKQSFIYDARLGRDRREVVAALVGALLVDPHSELQAAWRAVIRRGSTPADLAAFGAMPLTAGGALELARTTWKSPAARNQRKIDWQQWAQKKYREIQEPRAPISATGN